MVVLGNIEFMGSIYNLLREASLFMGWGAPKYGNRYNSRYNLIFASFLQSILLVLTPKESKIMDGLKSFAPPLMTRLKYFAPPS